MPGGATLFARPHDLRIANGYCLGWTDAQNVVSSDEGLPGTFSSAGPTPPASRRKANGS